MTNFSKIIRCLFSFIPIILITILLIMLASIVPSLLDKSVYLELNTLFRFLFLILLLFILQFVLLSKNTNNKYLKFEILFGFIIYTFIVIFINYIRKEAFSYINFIPFKSIVSFGYDFITLTETVSYMDCFKKILYPTFYLLPYFIYLKCRIRNISKYFILSIFLVIMLELINYFSNSIFNIDNILLGILGAYITQYLLPNHQCLKKG